MASSWPAAWLGSLSSRGDKHRVATTVGFGPRYLHSTGQLHKGGPNTGVFIQVVDPDMGEDLAIPHATYSFGDLISAQAQGDYRSLHRPGDGWQGDPGATSRGDVMKIGLVGLGRMGGNMKERLERDGHEVIGYSRSNTQQAKDLADLVSQLPSPKVVWLMVPSGDVTQRNIDDMCKLLDEGDVLTTAATPTEKAKW